MKPGIDGKPDVNAQDERSRPHMSAHLEHLEPIEQGEARIETPSEDVSEVGGKIYGPPKKRARKQVKKVNTQKEPAIVLTLLRLDPMIQFLTRATGKPLVPIKTIKATLPLADETMLKHIPELAERGVLQIVGAVDDSLTWDLEYVCIGFPPPPSLDASQNQSLNTNGTLHGSTKTAAKRRLATLRRSLKGKPGALVTDAPKLPPLGYVGGAAKEDVSVRKDWSIPVRTSGSDNEGSDLEDEVILEEEKAGRASLEKTLRFSARKLSKKGEFSNTRQSLTEILPKQASYAGSNPGRASTFAHLDENTCIPPDLMDAFGIERPGPCPVISQQRKLFTHQVTAIDSAMRGIHTLVCTGTGSGKSLCFLLPVLAAAMNGETSLLLFPTKALAQDQMTKLASTLEKFPDLKEKICPGIIDGDTSYAKRSDNAKNCNVILTNPDTLHAAILPGWKPNYKMLLGRIKYVVIDEAHMYEGVFGAHVAMVLSRFLRLTAVCSHKAQGAVKVPVFLACSATMAHPEHHFRLLCPIPNEAIITILAPDDDGSPRAPKHFFVWNPPIMDINGSSTGRVTVPRSKKKVIGTDGSKMLAVKTPQGNNSDKRFRESDELQLADIEAVQMASRGSHYQSNIQLYRRHAADETALLLARAVSQGVRCIAFCKTRCLVEWVYERAVSALKSSPSTEHLANQVESYRGGYTKELRRSIESRLFRNDLLGVVGTNALELGVDVGGIDLTLHCGYPSSYASLLQQAGRAGRGTARLDVPSLSIMVCFNSPAEQHIHRHPQSLLSRGRSALVSMPINVGLVQGHLLCAGEEYPLTGQHPIKTLFETNGEDGEVGILNDYDLFGSEVVFRESIDSLVSTGMIKKTTMPVAASKSEIVVFKTHPFVDKPWTKVNLRSIEPINYSIVDLSHPMQGGRMNGVNDERAVLDNIPYSRVFYHAFPGAIISHRGRRYKVHSMTRPPAFADSCSGYKGGTLAAYAKPTSARYTTRPLSRLKITVVKQMERVDVLDERSNDPSADERKEPLIEEVYANADDVQDLELTRGSLAGNGVITVRRTVHGYKKLSPITRVELSRTEISLPPMEFDTFAFWLDTEATFLRSAIKDYDEGVHALSHAILSVAPLFVPSGGSDLNCDHNSFDCTRVVIFDNRAGGSGNCAQLFKHLFVPDGLLEAAIDLMESCSQCRGERNYDGGCPACLHFGQCLKFNQDLNRTAAIHIGRRVLKRIQGTERYKANERQLDQENKDQEQNDAGGHEIPLSPDRRRNVNNVSSPRRNARAKALRFAMEVKPTKEREVILGRPSWPTDGQNGRGGRQVGAD